MDDNIVSLTLKEAGELMEGCGVAQGNIEEALAFFHEMGTLFWINDVHLRKVVVLDPFEAFVKPIRTIICDPQLHTDEEPHKSCKTNKKMSALYHDYVTYGRLDTNDLLPALL